MSQDTITLELETRTVLGKSVKHLRSAGQVPAVIHDHGKPSLVMQGDGIKMLKVWRAAGKHHPVQLTADKKAYTAIIKSATFNPKRHELTHIVFNAVSATEKVDAEIPVHAKYDEGNDASPAERAGLLVLTQLDTVAVKAIASKLPDALYYSAEKLVEVGDHVTVADLVIPEGVEVQIDENHALATVFEPSAMAAANEAAGGDAEAEDSAAVVAENGSDDAAAAETDAKTE